MNDHADLAHSHSHGHSHASVGSWQQWRSDSTLRAISAAIVLAGVLTIVGVIALWPSAEGTQDAIDNAQGIGLGSERYSAIVEQVTEQLCSYSTSESQQRCSTVSLRLQDGPDVGEVVVLAEINLEFDVSAPDLRVGDDVIAAYEPATDTYFYGDRDRRGALGVLLAIFVLVVLALGRWRGMLALLAMALTVAVLVWFVAPSVLDGNNPLLVAVVAAAAIAFVSLYLTHGFSPTTTVALAGTLGALGLTLGLSWVFFQLMNFTGFATEEALILPFISAELDVPSLLLGGAILGALGALDDVTITQVATVAELRFRNEDLSVGQLVASGIRVGREHIASTVNTLLLAYAGASVPLLLLFSASNQSLDIVANSELIAIEIVRTLGGSIGLVAAVPITTVLAAVVVSGRGEASVDGESVDAEVDRAETADPGAANVVRSEEPAEPLVGSKPVESTPVEQQMVEQQMVEQQMVEQQMVEQQMVEQQIVAPEPTDADWEAFAPREDD